MACINGSAIQKYCITIYDPFSYQLLHLSGDIFKELCFHLKKISKMNTEIDETVPWRASNIKTKYAIQFLPHIQKYSVCYENNKIYLDYASLNCIIELCERLQCEKNENQFKQ